MRGKWKVVVAVAVAVTGVASAVSSKIYETWPPAERESYARNAVNDLMRRMVRKLQPDVDVDYTLKITATPNELFPESVPLDISLIVPSFRYQGVQQPGFNVKVTWTEETGEDVLQTLINELGPKFKNIRGVDGQLIEWMIRENAEIYKKFTDSGNSRGNLRHLAKDDNKEFVSVRVGTRVQHTNIDSDAYQSAMDCLLKVKWGAERTGPADWQGEDKDDLMAMLDSDDDKDKITACVEMTKLKKFVQDMAKVQIAISEHEGVTSSQPVFFEKQFMKFVVADYNRKTPANALEPTDCDLMCASNKCYVTVLGSTTVVECGLNSEGVPIEGTRAKDCANEEKIIAALRKVRGDPEDAQVPDAELVKLLTEVDQFQVVELKKLPMFITLADVVETTVKNVYQRFRPDLFSDNGQNMKKRRKLSRAKRARKNRLSRLSHRGACTKLNGKQHANRHKKGLAKGGVAKRIVRAE